MAIGGAVLRARCAKCGYDESGTATTSMASTMNTRPAVTKGCTSGNCGLSSDCLLSGSCAWVWQSAGCSLSMPSQSGMTVESALIDVGAELLPVPAVSPGQAYAATANCMNSRLQSMAKTEMIRDGREIFIKRAIGSFVDLILKA